MDWFQVQGDNSSDRDLNAVQRGDAEMEQKMNRALRACLERSDGNPIRSIHDQGAGGNGGKLTRAFRRRKQSLSNKADADAVTHCSPCRECAEGAQRASGSHHLLQQIQGDGV